MGSRGGWATDVNSTLTHEVRRDGGSQCFQMYVFHFSFFCCVIVVIYFLSEFNLRRNLGRDGDGAVPTGITSGERWVLVVFYRRIDSAPAGALPPGGRPVE